MPERYLFFKHAYSSANVTINAAACMQWPTETENRTEKQVLVRLSLLFNYNNYPNNPLAVLTVKTARAGVITSPTHRS